MTEVKAKRRGHGDDAIYFAAEKNRYVGAVSLGHGADGRRIRRKVLGRTKQEVKDKLRALHLELEVGVRTSSTYTVQQAIDDWLTEGLDGRSERTRTLYAGLLKPVTDLIGAKLLRELSAGNVRAALVQLKSKFTAGWMRPDVAPSRFDLHALPLIVAGHFAQQEAPEATWKLIAEFAGL
jgi:hypothetical protein